jgi:hypothetical protein
VILLSLLWADTRSQDRGPLHCNRLRGSLSVPCSIQALMLDDASLAALGAGTNNFFGVDIIVDVSFGNAPFFPLKPSSSLMRYCYRKRNYLALHMQTKKKEKPSSKSDSLTVECRHTPASRRLGVSDGCACLMRGVSPSLLLTLLLKGQLWPGSFKRRTATNPDILIRER